MAIAAIRLHAVLRCGSPRQTSYSAASLRDYSWARNGEINHGWHHARASLDRGPQFALQVNATRIDLTKLRNISNGIEQDALAEIVSQARILWRHLGQLNEVGA